jgi:hypothetical protein
MSLSAESLPQIRFDITEASRILRMSRASLYERIRLGEIKSQKDGRRSNSQQRSCNATSTQKADSFPDTVFLSCRSGAST